MNLLLTLILVVTVGAYAEPQFYPSYFNGNNYFRAGLPEPSYDEQKPNNGGRFLLPTLSLTFATTTMSSSTTITTTCTTSTAALIQCTNSGRRRRGALLTDNNTDGLYYSEEEKEGHFLPLVATVEEKPGPSQEVESMRVERQAPQVPFIVQPGFNAPIGAGRVILAFGTSTVTYKATFTTTATLTATCSSTTSYQLCGYAGK